jgi:hypothetical protein
MFYKNLIYFFLIFFVFGCTTNTVQNNNIELLEKNLFSNKGFSLVYNETLYQKKIVSKKLDERGLLIFQKNLKKNSLVKIRNILNNKTILAKVGKNASYPPFNNSVISKRIANELDLNLSEPYTEITSISENSVFFAKRAKTFDEEKNVANKVPVKNISINDLNKKKEKKLKKTKKNFSYTIKIADFYFSKTALLMVKRIKNETKIKNPKIKKISNEEYRVYLGPFDNISSLQNSFNDINILGFENLEIIKND